MYFLGINHAFLPFCFQNLKNSPLYFKKKLMMGLCVAEFGENHVFNLSYLLSN